MRNKSLLLAVLLVLCTSLSAQTITHSFRNTSMADALRYLSMASHQYLINFAYDDLEDFKVTTDVRNQTVPDAIRQIIGFYPIGMKVVDGGKDAQGKPFPDLIFVECIQKESRKLTGRVVDENGQPMEFVNVAVLNPRDSSFINGGVTTAAGDFVIPCKATDVLVSLTSVGYRRLVRHITTAHAGVLTMRPDAYSLKTVTVKGRRKVEHEDRNVYTFSDEEVKASREAQQLIATLPGLRVDVLSGQLATLSGKPLTILVNGIESNDNDLKALQAKDIRNVDYYVVPPARYADAGAVLNIHTRAAENGYATGFDVMQGTKAGFNNTNAYAKYNHGPHQFSLDYRLELRNAPNCDEQDVYTFKDGDKRATYDYSGTYHFGYASHDFNLKYLFTRGDSLNFQAKFTPTIFTWFWNSDMAINAAGNPLWNNGTQDKRQRQNSFSPSLDLYFDRKLPGGHEVMLNVVGTLFHNNQHVHNTQNDETQQTLDDDMRQHNNKYSFIGEAAYTKDWGRTQLALGYRATLAKSDYRISNMLSDYKKYEYNATDDKHYAYAQLNGSIAKIGYRISLGATYINTSNDDTHFHKLYFTPEALITYNMKKGALRLHGKMSTITPNIASLSNNSTVTIPGLLYSGNPWLESALDKKIGLTYSLNLPWLNMDLTAEARKIDNDFSTYYQWQTVNDERVIVGRDENCDYLLNYGFAGSLTIRPLGNDLLTIGVETGYKWQKEKSDIIGVHRHHYMPLAWTVDFRKGCWGAEYYQCIPHKQLNGSFISSAENTQNLIVYYQKKQLMVGLVCIFPFAAAKYNNSILDNDVLDNHGWNRVTSQKRTFCITLSYNLFSGKQNNDEKKLNNKDNDQGFF